MDTYYSKFAKKLFIKYKKNMIMYSNEVLSHDGCDEFGYESDIYDLYMIVKNNSNQYDYYHFVLENWFDQDSNTLEYSIYEKFTTPKLHMLKDQEGYDPRHDFHAIQKQSI